MAWECKISFFASEYSNKYSGYIQYKSRNGFDTDDKIYSGGGFDF